MDKRVILKRFSILVFTLAVLAMLALSVDWRETYVIVQNGDPYLIGLAVLFTFLRFLIWTYKWRKTISPLARISFSNAYHILMAGVFLSQITPGRDTGGEPIRALYVSRLTGLKKRQALATIILDKTGNYIAVATFIFYAVLFIALFMDIPSSVKLALEGLLLFFFLAAVSAAIVKKKLYLPGIPARALKRIYYLSPLKNIRERFTTYSSFEEYVMERITEFITTLRDLSKEKKNTRDNLLLSYVIWIMVFIQTYLVFLALGQRVSFLMIVAVEAISILMGIVSILPGGAGTTEVTMIALFRSAGIGVEIATAATILSRGIYYAFSLGLGYVSLIYLRYVESDTSQ